MRKLITSLVIVALLLTLAPAVVYAADDGVTAEAQGGNTAPTVTTVTLVEAGDDTVVTAMIPLSTYRVKVTAGDINTINDIKEIEFHVFFSADGSSWDADALGKFLWTKSGDVWTMENGSSVTTWEVASGSCISPSVYTGSTGDWYLAFKPGKLAQSAATASWFASATAYDENKSGSNSWATGASMGAYAEVSMSETGVTFGDNATGIEPGATGYITNTVDNKLVAQVITNKGYAVGVSSTANWTDGGSKAIALSETAVLPPGGTGEFTLIIDNETLGAPGEPKTKTQGVTTVDTTILGLGTLTRVSTNANASEGTGNTDLYAALAFSLSGIDEVTYGGTITFTVTN